MADYKHIITIKPRERKESGRRAGVVRPKRIRDSLGRRKVGSHFWDFYDLGTRLQAVDEPSDFTNGYRELGDSTPVSTDPAKFLEYVELFFSSPATVNQIAGVGVPLGEIDVYDMLMRHVQVDPDTPAEILTWDAATLNTGPDPFSSTRQEGDDTRSIPNCMPIKYEGRASSTFFPFQPDAFDIVLYDAELPGGSAGSHFANTPGFRANAFRLGRTNTITASPEKWESPDDPDADPPVLERRDGEQWNPLSLAQPWGLTEIDIEARGRMEMSGEKGAVHIRIESPIVYESFDTGDTTNYKVTNQPSFGAPEVAFDATRSTPLKFYLKPQWHGYFRWISSFGNFNWQYETYRLRQDNGTYYNRWTMDTIQGGHPGTSTRTAYFCQITSRISGGYVVPDNPADEGTVTFNLNRVTGAYEVTGLPGGASVSGTGVLTPLPGFADRWLALDIETDYLHIDISFSEDSSGGDESYQEDYELVWASYGIPWSSPTNEYQNFGVSSSMEWAVGGHIGRAPVFPRSLSAFWFNIDGTNGQVRTYSDGSTKTYFTATANAMPGQMRSVANDGHGSMTKMYERHAGRDGSALLAIRSAGQKIRLPPPTGSPFEAVAVTPATANYRTDVAGAEAYGQSTINAIHAQASSLLSAAHFRNVVITNPPNFSHTNTGAINAVPIDAPAGLLCGVIVKGSTRYYVWRKTAETRRTYDYDRRQTRYLT